MTLTEKIVNSLHCRFRKYLPDPKITARLYGTEKPVSYIKGMKTRLSRPETVVFSPSGDLMAVVNSELTNAVVFYDRDESQTSHFASKPFHIISNPDLVFAHDAALTPCGNYIAIVARDTHNVLMYKLHRENEKNMTTKLIWSFSGDESALSFPHSVKFHPSGTMMAVGNQLKYGVALYYAKGSNGEFDSKPFQTISEDDLFKGGMAPSHCLDFSPDGKYLAVTHRTFYMNKDSKGESGLSIFAVPDESEKGLDPEPLVFIPYEWADFLHSVAFSPSGELLALVLSARDIEFFSWQEEHQTLKKLGSIHVYNGRFGEGPKGVTFTNDGKQITVTTEFDEVLFYDVDQMIPVA